ncbi:MAG: hypothetical protein ABSG83_19600, partial [Roseiarcus sp.]
APNGAGIPIMSAGSAISVSSAIANTNGNVQFLGINNSNTQAYNLPILYFRVGTASGSISTASVIIYIWPLP